MNGWLMVIGACIGFAVVLKLAYAVIDEELARRRKISGMKRQQDKAMEVAEELIVFDQEMTREHLIRVWEKVK